MTAEQNEVENGIWGVFPNGTQCKIPIMCVAGDKSSGKTFLASTIDPENTAMVDLEDSSETYSFPYRARFSLFEHLSSKVAAGTKPTPIMAFEFVKDILESKTALAGCTVVAIDPASDFTQGLFDYIVANAQEFGLSAGQIDSMTGLVWGKAKAYLKTLIGIASKNHGIQTVVICLHSGTVWKGGKPTSQKKAKGVDTYYELASLFLWLERPVNKEVPNAITSPPLGKSRLSVPVKDNDGNWSGVSCFPPVIPNCTVATIKKYIANPPDYAKLKKSEKFVERELTEAERLEMELSKAEAIAEAERLKTEQLVRTQNAYAAVAKQPAEAKKTAEKPVAEQSTPVETATTAVQAATADLGPSSEELTLRTVEEAVSSVSDQQVSTLKGLYDVLVTRDPQFQERWSKALDSFGCKTATQLTQDAAEQLTFKIQQYKESLDGQNEIDQWAQTAVGN